MRARPAPPPGAPPLPHLPPTQFEIVGVIKDVRNVPLGQATEPAVYFSTRQFPFRELFLTVRAADERRRGGRRSQRPPAGGAQGADGADADLGRPLRTKTAEPRLLMTILTFFGALAGISGGARRLRPVLLVGRAAHARAGDSLDAWREAAGRRRPGGSPERRADLRRIGGRPGLIRVAESALARVLFGVTPSDPVSTLAAEAVLIAAALIACIPPAIRAMRVDPVIGLRAE